MQLESAIAKRGIPDFFERQGCLLLTAVPEDRNHPGLIRFTPDVVAECSRVLARSTAAWPSLRGDCVIKKHLIDDLLDGPRKLLSKFSELAMIEKLNIDLINRGG